MTEEFGDILVLETNRDVTERRAIHERVCRLAEELEDRVKDRTKELLQSQTLLRQLASELTIAEQRERRRIATDLHDYLAQLLVCARLKVAQSRGRMGSEVESWLGESDDILQQALTYTRSLVAQLTPMALHEFGLAAALKWLADQMRQQYRLSVQVDVQHGMSVTLPEDQSVLIFQSIKRAPHPMWRSMPASIRRRFGWSSAERTAGDRCHRRRPRIRYDHFTAPNLVFEIWIVQHPRTRMRALGGDLRIPVHTRQGHDGHAHAAPSCCWRRRPGSYFEAAGQRDPSAAAARHRGGVFAGPCSEIGVWRQPGTHETE